MTRCTLFKLKILLGLFFVLIPGNLLIYCSGTIYLEPGDYYYESYKLRRDDSYVWDYSSTNATIMILACNQEQYENGYPNGNYTFINVWERYASNSTNGFGFWVCPYKDTWHFYYVNDDVVPTYLDSNSFRSISQKYRSTWLTIGVIGSVIVLFLFWWLASKQNRNV
jgi:hypothetical protein